MLGSAAYLEEFAERAADFVYGIFLEMLGNDNRLLLQRTFDGNSKLDAVAERVLKTSVPEFEIDGFRAQVGNDELVFESPGYEIPTISVLRGPYPEYHTHFDDPSIIEESRLEAAVDYVLDVMDILENDFVPLRAFSGLPSLANPKYDLYIDPRKDGVHLDDDVLPDVEIAGEGEIDLFRNRVFRYLDGDHSVFDIAREFGLTFEFVESYLREFEDKDLVRAELPSDCRNVRQ
jgi:aminopeptidase-like protein